MTVTQQKILLRVSAWAVKQQEARAVPRDKWSVRALAVDRAAFEARLNVEQALLALSPEDMEELQAGLGELVIDKDE